MYTLGTVDEKTGHQVYLGSFLSFYLMWNTTTIIGVIAGELIPGMSEWGLEFAMVATFIGIITPYLKSAPFRLAAVTAGVASVLLIHLPHNLGLLTGALLGVAAGFFSEQYLAKGLAGEEVCQ
jgi:predicted branched-subunit amino acid permease